MRHNQSGEDYLETILLLSGEKPAVHRIDVARAAGVSQPAVQKAVIEEIEKTTGMTVLKVNVVVQEIDDPVLEDPEEEETEGSAPVLPLN